MENREQLEQKIREALDSFNVEDFLKSKELKTFLKNSLLFLPKITIKELANVAESSKVDYTLDADVKDIKDCIVFKILMKLNDGVYENDPLYGPFADRD